MVFKSSEKTGGVATVVEVKDAILASVSCKRTEMGVELLDAAGLVEFEIVFRNSGGKVFFFENQIRREIDITVVETDLIFSLGTESILNCFISVCNDLAVF
jgi:hypothetical protein